ncbi:retinol dehydrogenase 12 (all-trans 9-cis 11-cis) [Clonorchis sinensis]|uniref:Retinol dehydrogenase 12 (All-trans 9-cis 11-cis) n=1 Tax=Clonorchis sinensis TaxID=79923 RepID=A0A8T1MRF0_CLOSI|nr:retinol dehydrogenase 12 (all-trans 9-cis 11-cis) [Clonorchis sinensis]
MTQLSAIFVGFVAAGGVLILMFRLFRRRTIICNCISSSGKHAVITGATSGIGRATAMALAQRNWKITLGCRDITAADQVKREITAATGNRDIRVEHLDLTERPSIDRFAKVFEDVPVHALVNNAGVMTYSPGRVSSFGGVTVDVATNYLGTAYLTHLMIPHLRRVHGDSVYYPRIILVSSSLASRGHLDALLEPWSPTSQWNAMQAYSNSKLASCLFARELHRRFGSGPNKKVDVYCLFTGGMVNTRLSRHMLTNYPAPIQWLWSILAKLLLKTPFEGCQSLIHCAVSQNVPGAHCKDSDGNKNFGISGSGLLFSNCVPVPWPDNMNDMQEAQSLWRETMSFLNIVE